MSATEAIAKEDDNSSHVYYSFGGQLLGYFEVKSQYRSNLAKTLQNLKRSITKPFYYQATSLPI
ncbi:MAG: hypothetical protein R2822_25605 [Spirosomataceae bacterium]